MKPILFWNVIILALLASCSTPQPIVQSIEVTREITRLVAQTVIIEKIITATPEPATPQPSTTPTPLNTPTSTFAQYSANQVVSVLKAAGVEVENPTPMTKADYGMAPMAAREAIHFFIPSLCSDCGGRIFSFDDEGSLKMEKGYYDELARGSAILFSWTFTRGNILIQINGDLEETKAKKYEAALATLP